MKINLLFPFTALITLNLILNSCNEKPIGNSEKSLNTNVDVDTCSVKPFLEYKFGMNEASFAELTAKYVSFNKLTKNENNDLIYRFPYFRNCEVIYAKVVPKFEYKFGLGSLALVIMKKEINGVNHELSTQVNFSQIKANSICNYSYESNKVNYIFEPQFECLKSLYDNKFGKVNSQNNNHFQQNFVWSFPDMQIVMGIERCRVFERVNEARGYDRGDQIVKMEIVYNSIDYIKRENQRKALHDKNEHNIQISDSISTMKDI